MSVMHVSSNKKGFTLVEVIATMAIFGLVMVIMTQMLSVSFSTYFEARKLQRNMESIQEAAGLMAKGLRTSSIVETGSSVDVNLSSEQQTAVLVVFDYSRNQCVKYDLSAGVTMSTAVAGVSEVDNSHTCPSATATNGWTSVGLLAAAPVNGVFYAIIPSKKAVEQSGNITPAVSGRVSIALSPFLIASSSQTAPEFMNYRTTVSLRDYGFTGIN